MLENNLFYCFIFYSTMLRKKRVVYYSERITPFLYSYDFINIVYDPTVTIIDLFE